MHGSFTTQQHTAHHKSKGKARPVQDEIGAGRPHRLTSPSMHFSCQKEMERVSLGLIWKAGLQVELHSVRKAVWVYTVTPSPFSLGAEFLHHVSFM